MDLAGVGGSVWQGELGLIGCDTLGYGSWVPVCVMWYDMVWYGL